MAKQDWANSDIIVRSSINRPFWIASGIVSGSDVLLSMGPGRVRYPQQNATVFSGQPQRVTITNAAASRYYNVFQRSGGTFMVSGSTVGAVPAPPRRDAEYLGQVFTGASLATANLKGPWNAGAFEWWDQRGEMPTVGAGQGIGIYYKQDSTKIGSVPFINHNTAATASGIGYLNTTTASPAHLGAFLVGRATWVPSGALTGGALYMEPVFGLRIAGAASDLAQNRQSLHFTVAQNPDTTHAANRGQFRQLTSVVAVYDPDFSVSAGYVLASWFGNNTDNAAAGQIDPAIRIQTVDFCAVGTFYNVNTTEPS